MVKRRFSYAAAPPRSGRQYTSELKQIFAYYSQPTDAEIERVAKKTGNGLGGGSSTALAAGSVFRGSSLGLGLAIENIHRVNSRGAEPALGQARGGGLLSAVQLPTVANTSRPPSSGLAPALRLSAAQAAAAADNALAMPMLEFWRFARDCCLPDSRLTLAEIDRIFLRAEASRRAAAAVNGNIPTEGCEGPAPLAAADAMEVHNPNGQLIFRAFLEGVVRLADFKYPVREGFSKMKFHEKKNFGFLPASWCFAKSILLSRL